MQCALWYYSLNVRLKSEQPIFDALLPPKLWLLHIFTLLSSGCDCLCLLLWYISCELVIVDLIVCTLKRVLLRMQYVMEYPHMILLTKQHFTTIQPHTVLDNHPHPHFIFSIFCKSYIKLFLFVFYLQYQVPREFSLTMTLTIQPCVLYAIFLPAGNCF